MTALKKYIGIIPARYASTRFPGKPLAIIQGKPMIQRVYEQASKVMDRVYVATDDERIFKAVRDFGGRVIMTSPHHSSGTDRCAEAVILAEQELGENFDVVLNIQGDEPFIEPQQISLLMECFEDPRTQIATLVKRATLPDEVFNPNRPKVVLGSNRQALYFSRSPIPFVRGAENARLAPFSRYLPAHWPVCICRRMSCLKLPVCRNPLLKRPNHLNNCAGLRTDFALR